MLRRFHFEKQLRIGWCAVVAFAAVCSLTVSLATRYSYSGSISLQSVKTAGSHPSPDSKVQRLTKNGAAWVPPVFHHAALQAPSLYPRLAPAGPSAPSLLLEENLFTRPPPQA